MIRGDRPVGTLLLLWPTLWALWLAAEGFPPTELLLIFAAGVWLTRSAGCIINDYADRWLDPQVERTRSRPLARGALSGREALAAFVLMMLAAFGLVLLTNTLTIGLSLVGAVLAATYPYLKRHTYFPQVYLGVAFGWGIPMAFAAVQGRIPQGAWLLFLANLLWTTAYDTWYAMVDREDDLKIGIKTSAITFGRYDVAAVMACYGLTLAILAGVGFAMGLGWSYWLGLLAAAGIAIYHYGLIKDRDTGRCFAAFMHNNWFGAAIFAGIALDTLL